MESGDWIGLSALAVALLSFFANAYFTRNERQTRVTEINLLRRQVEGEADERDAAAADAASSATSART